MSKTESALPPDRAVIQAIHEITGNRALGTSAQLGVCGLTSPVVILDVCEKAAELAHRDGGSIPDKLAGRDTGPDAMIDTLVLLIGSLPALRKGDSPASL